MGTEKTEFEGWAILEFMGHRKIGGFVRPVTIAGAGMLRVDIPEPTAKDETGPWYATSYYPPTSLYCLTPCAADVAIRFAATCRPEPVQRWELPAIESAKRTAPADDIPFATSFDGEYDLYEHEDGTD